MPWALVVAVAAVLTVAVDPAAVAAVLIVAAGPAAMTVVAVLIVVVGT